MNSMKKTLSLMSFALLLIPFFAPTNVEAKRKEKDYIFEFTDSFKAMDGDYEVFVDFPSKRAKFDIKFGFSINDGVISHITGRNAKDVKINADNTLTVNASKAIYHRQGALIALGVLAAGAFAAIGVAVHPTLYVTALSGDLAGVKGSIKVKQPLEVGGMVDHFMLDGNATTKTITITETMKKQAIVKST